ncbi:golgin [Holotrichia oblita]|uniref:Golgin n=1 Tax=Holotrichia oblita TaxID=644536 RepID=A0ACB9SMN3_HOLOL|nr:golgin [Holotrichia oblita]
MFKKLKDKIAEDLKFSPQRLTQGNNEKTQSNNTNSNNDENFFSITEDDAPASTSSLGDEFTDVSLHASTPMESRTRKLSNSSFASDISFLPRYEPSGNLYHMQSDVDASASEMEDNVSTSSQLGHISKEQVYAAFQKAQMRYHKYRGRYTDLANHYKILEKENAKIRTILVDTQDKAIRRVNELKEQCGLEQKAKAHLENALRVELDEKQIKIDTLQTKIKLLQTSDRSEQLIDVSDNSRSTSNSSLSENQELTKYLNDARVEIENLNGRLQEMKANAIIFNSKESDYKSKITNLEKLLSERNGR